MDAVVRYVLATLIAVIGGWVGYYLVPYEPFGVVGNVLFMGALFGLFAGLLDIAGFFGNVVNAFLISMPLWFVLPGEWFVIWVGGNVGYAVGNVLGQLARLSAENKIEAKAL
jgi:hypothetical protein